jgi:hypothetical protein
MSDPVCIEELQALYDEVSAGSYEPNLVVTTTELARKYMVPEEVAAIDAFLVEHPGKNWHLDRDALIVTELPDDGDDDA